MTFEQYVTEHQRQFICFMGKLHWIGWCHLRCRPMLPLFIEAIVVYVALSKTKNSSNIESSHFNFLRPRKCNRIFVPNVWKFAVKSSNRKNRPTDRTPTTTSAAPAKVRLCTDEAGDSVFSFIYKNEKRRLLAVQRAVFNAVSICVRQQHYVPNTSNEWSYFRSYSFAIDLSWCLPTPPPQVIYI